MSTTHEHDHDHAHEAVAQHSMVLFGDKTLYLSHMPDFEAPHNLQIVVEISLSKNGEDKYREDRKTGRVTYSVEPQPVALSALKPGLSFTGDVHRGNFEVKRDLLVPKVTLTVKSLVLLRTVDPATAPDPSAGRRYLCFGKPGDLFAIHEVDGPPTFDHIVAITMDDPQAAKLSFAEATPLRLSGTDDSASRLKPGEAADAELPEATGPNGEHGVRTKIVAGDEFFFDERFLV
jgi:hypothetical protein